MSTENPDQAPLPGLTPDMLGFAAAVATQDDELPFTPSGIRHTVYGALYCNARALVALQRAVDDAVAGYHEEARQQLKAAMDYIDDAVSFGYNFASLEYREIADERGITEDDEAYDAFVEQRMEGALDYDEKEDPNAAPE